MILLPGLKHKLAKGIEQGVRNSAIKAPGALLLCCLSVPLQAASPPHNRALLFDIPLQSADESLIEFARQADLTIVFPFDKVKNSRANRLTGEHSVQEGINILLRNTGLVAEFNDKGVITIRTAEDIKADKDRSTIARIIQLFTEDDSNLITYPKQQEEQYELIMVKGIRGSMHRALDIRQNAMNIVDAISAEDIGKFPDLNLAESLQRITGVSIDRSEGEGQFVTVRGFGPEFNTVLTNGRRLATDNRGREFSFDTLASELVSGVSVYKTFSASQQTGGIGSVIDIKTARPLQAHGFKVAGSVKAMYDTNSKETTPQGTVLLSNSNRKFGWLVSLSHQKRKARINEAQTDGWLLNTDIPEAELSTQSDNIFVPRNYDQRVRFDTRERTGGTIVLQYRPTTNLDLSLDLLTSQFDVKTDSTSMGHWFTSSNLEDVITDENGTVIKFQQQVGHATDFHARTFDRPSKISAIGFNANWQSTDSLSLEFDMSLSDATIDDKNGAANALSLIGYLNRSQFDHSLGYTLPGISNFATADPGILDAAGNPAGVEHYLSPSNGRSHVMLRRGWDIRDDLDQLRFDGNWDVGIEHVSDFNFGMMYTRQAKQNDRWDNEANAVHCTFCGYFDNPDLPDSFQTEFRAGNNFLDGVSGNQNIPKIWLRHSGEQLFAFLEQSGGLSFDAVKRDNSFSIKEHTFSTYAELESFYAQSDWALTMQVGLRFEKSRVNVDGIEADLQALTILDQTELGQITSTPSPLSKKADYTNWLPGFSAKLELYDQFIGRLAVSKSLTRPTMSQMSPSLVLNTTRQGGDLRASSGNPALKPFESTNIDLSFDWYYAPSNYLSISYFRKKVDNFIVSTVSNLVIPGVTDPSTGTDPSAPDNQDSIANFDLTQPVNGETATVFGWEVAIQHTFDSGFGILANFTKVDSNAQLDRQNVSQKFALTGLSDSQNIIGFYEQGPVQLRLAWNNRDEFLQSLVQIQGGEPTFVDEYHQLDMSANYQFNEHLSFFIEGINITEEHIVKHGRYDNQLLLAQSPGARYTMGIRGSY